MLVLLVDILATAEQYVAVRGFWPASGALSGMLKNQLGIVWVVDVVGLHAAS